MFRTSIRRLLSFPVQHSTSALGGGSDPKEGEKEEKIEDEDGGGEDNK